VRTKKESRQKLQDHLKAKGVATGIHYPIALPNLKAYSYLKHGKNDFPEATKASEEIFSLPMYPELTENQIQFIAGEIKEFGQRNKV
jgi:dTDP-4-amino-4,6-dideoxygalactose transaminase